MVAKKELSLGGLSAVRNQRSPQAAEAAMLHGGEKKRSALDFLADESFTGKSPAESNTFAGKSGGEIVVAPLADISPNPHNARRLRSSAWIEELAASLAADGQKVPAAAFVDANGRYTLIDGETRRQAAEKAGLNFLKLHLHPKPKTDAELYRLSRTLNAERKDMSILDDAYAWRELLTSKVFATHQELAQSLGISPEHISNVLGILELPTGVLALLDDLPEPPGIRWLIAFRAFIRDVGEEEGVALITRHAKDPLSSREVDRLRVKSVAATRTRTKFSSLKFDGRVKGSLQLSEDGSRLQINVQALPGEVLDELADEIEKLIRRREKAK